MTFEGVEVRTKKTQWENDLCEPPHITNQTGVDRRNEALVLGLGLVTLQPMKSISRVKNAKVV